MQRRGAGMDENKRGMEALCTKVAAQVKEHQHDTNKQLNQVRLELARQTNSSVLSCLPSTTRVSGTRVKNQASKPIRLCSTACVVLRPNGSRDQPT